MQRSGYAPGETTVSRIKSLWLTIQLTKGLDEAAAFLHAIDVEAPELDDETRPLALDLLHAALLVFVERYGRELLQETWRGAAHPDNVAVWPRVVRGTTDPAGAFRQIQGLGTEGQRTTEWETLDEGVGMWFGRVVVRHDPALEKDGLLNALRCAELAAIPVFYGLAPAEVEVVVSARGTFASRTGATGTEFRARFRRIGKRTVVPTASTVGAIAGASAFVVSPTAGGLGLISGLVLGTLGGFALAAHQQRQREQQAIGMRLRASERQAELRERAPLARAAGEGTVIAGLYRLGAALGTGAAGIIHRGTRLSDHSPVAVKILRAAVAHDTIASDRLRREAEAMRLAWHPHVVELLDHGALPDGSGYIVMEQLDGEPLSDRLEREGPMESEQVRTLALQLCDALGAIHAAGVIHRDLKPSNLYLVKTGSRFRLKIIDFGVARVEWAETRLTGTDTPIGTPGYMSPEQRAADEDVDGRSDLYAVGALLHECLTGSLPERISGVGVGPSSDRPSGVQRTFAGLPDEWHDIVRCCLSVARDERYHDARALRVAIEEAFQRDREAASGTPADERSEAASFVPKSGSSSVLDSPKDAAADEQDQPSSA
jgi:serine/threonine protein kinase